MSHPATTTGTTTGTPATCTDPYNHRPGTLGCATVVPDCNGIPTALADTITEHPITWPALTGADEIGAELAGHLRHRFTVGEVTTGYTDTMRTRGVREVATWSTTANGHTVTAVRYSGRATGLSTLQDHVAVLVNGVPAGSARTVEPADIARVARDYIMDLPAAPADAAPADLGNALASLIGAGTSDQGDAPAGPWVVVALPRGGNPGPFIPRPEKPGDWLEVARYADRAEATREAVALADSGTRDRIRIEDGADGADVVTVATWDSGRGWTEWGRMDDRGWVDRAAVELLNARTFGARKDAPALADTAPAVAVAVALVDRRVTGSEMKQGMRIGSREIGKVRHGAGSAKPWTFVTFTTADQNGSTDGRFRRNGVKYDAQVPVSDQGDAPAPADTTPGVTVTIEERPSGTPKLAPSPGAPYAPPAPYVPQADRPDVPAGMPYVTDLPDSWTGPVIDLSAKALGALLRRKGGFLAHWFPRGRFSVRTDGGSVDVRWKGGPTSDLVALVVKMWQGKSRDSLNECDQYRGAVLYVAPNGAEFAYKLPPVYVTAERERGTGTGDEDAARKFLPDGVQDFTYGQFTDPYGREWYGGSADACAQWMGDRGVNEWTRTAGDPRPVCPVERCVYAAGHAYPAMHRDDYGRAFLATLPTDEGDGDQGGDGGTPTDVDLVGPAPSGDQADAPAPAESEPAPGPDTSIMQRGAVRVQLTDAAGTVVKDWTRPTWNGGIRDSEREVRAIGREERAPYHGGTPERTGTPGTVTDRYARVWTSSYGELTATVTRPVPAITEPAESAPAGLPIGSRVLVDQPGRRPFVSVLRQVEDPRFRRDGWLAVNIPEGAGIQVKADDLTPAPEGAELGYLVEVPALADDTCPAFRTWEELAAWIDGGGPVLDPARYAVTRPVDVPTWSAPAAPAVTVSFTCPAHGAVPVPVNIDGEQAGGIRQEHANCAAGDPFGLKASEQRDTPAARFAARLVASGWTPEEAGRATAPAEEIRPTITVRSWVTAHVDDAPAVAELAPVKVGPVSVADLVAGDRVHVYGVDQFGSPTHGAGYVSGTPGAVTVRGRTKSGRVSKSDKGARPGLLVQLSENPGGWNGWRMTIITTVDAMAEYVTDADAHQFRPESESGNPFLCRARCSCGWKGGPGASRFLSERISWDKHAAPAGEAVRTVVTPEELATAERLGAEAHEFGCSAPVPAEDAEFQRLVRELPEHVAPLVLINAYARGYAERAEKEAEYLEQSQAGRLVHLEVAEQVAELNPATAWAVDSWHNAIASAGRTIDARRAEAAAGRTLADDTTEQPAPAGDGEDEGGAGTIYTAPMEWYAPQVDSDDDADITIMHDHEDGTVLHGSRRGDGVYEIAKAHGFDYRRTVGIFIPRSRDQFSQLKRIRECADALRLAGHTVAVMVDDVWRPAAVREEARGARVTARVERLTARSLKQSAAGDARREAARQLIDMMPFGEPVKMDHYSAPRHLRAFERIETNQRAAHAAYDYAQHLASRADGAASNEDAKGGPRAIMRRIERLEADQREAQRRLDEAAGARAANSARYWWLNLERITEDIAYQRAKLGDLAESGAFVAWGPEHFTKDDQANIGGRWYRVVRVSAKSLSLDGLYTPGYVERAKWDQVHGRRRDGVQLDTPNGKPRDIEQAKRVERWAYLTRHLTCASYDRTPEQESKRRHFAQARRVVLGLARTATAQEVDAFGEPVGEQEQHVRALAMLAAFERLEAGETFDQVAADTAPLGDTVPAWTMPAGEPERVNARDLVPGDIVCGVYDRFAGAGERLVSSMVGPVTAPPRITDRHESGEWYALEVDGEIYEGKTFRRVGAHLVGAR